MGFSGESTAHIKYQTSEVETFVSRRDCLTRGIDIELVELGAAIVLAPTIGSSPVGRMVPDLEDGAETGPTPQIAAAVAGTMVAAPVFVFLRL